MQKQWFVWSERFAKLNIREQYIILFAMVIVSYLLFDALALQSSNKQANRLENSISTLTNENRVLQLEVVKAQTTLANDPNKALDQQIEQYQKKLSQLDNDLMSLTNELIEPTEMRAALQDMLKLTPKVKLVSFESLAPAPLIKEELNSAGEVTQATSSQINLYQHDFNVTLEGSYFELRNYLKNVEKMPWSFYWHEFQYSIEKYPNATLNIKMYSLSTRKEFIGV